MLPYVPDNLPVDAQKLNWRSLINLVGKANSCLSQYNGLLESMVNPHILLSPMTTKEATLSSKIEGTQATLSEVLRYEAGENYDIEKVKDIEEIRNYREAMMMAEKMLEDRPFIHLNMIRDLHAILLAGVRGDNKQRGEFRISQNWIGTFGCAMEDAKYVPPSVFDMKIALDNWEKYVNEDEIDILIQLAFVHAQFEIIHPFLDGNGRIGRIIIPLFLYAKKYLKLPVFYLSEYLENNRDEYYVRLNNITSSGDWQGWIEFFLGAIIKQSEINTKKAKEVLELYDRMKTKFQEITHSQYSACSLDALFARPIVNSKIFYEQANIDRRATANGILKKLVDNNILKVLKKGRGSAPSTFVFAELMNLTEGRTFF